MDVLVALGTTIAFAFSAWVVLASRAEAMFFDVSAAVLLFVSLGRFFEDRARASAGGAIRALLGLAAKSVNVLREGREESLPLDQVAVGDVFRVRPGERVALDGVIPRAAAPSTNRSSRASPCPSSAAPAKRSWAARSTSTASSRSRRPPSARTPSSSAWPPSSPRRRARAPASSAPWTPSRRCSCPSCSRSRWGPSSAGSSSAIPPSRP